MNRLKESIILFVRLALYSLLFSVFFIVFATKNIGLTHISRTMVITMMTFIVIGSLMLIVYGRFNIGEEKPRPLIYSMMLAVFMTDIITYLQLMIMNTNPRNNVYFKIEHLDLLLIVLVIQLILIIIFSFVGNSLYFKIFKPLKTLVIYNEDEDSLNKIISVLKSYKLQYAINDVVNSYDDVAFSMIEENDFVVLLDMDDNRRNAFAEFCYDFNVSFSYAPSVGSIVSKSGQHLSFDDKPMINVNLGGLTIDERIIKRLFDIIISVLALTVLSPILMIVAIAIKLEDGGSVFFIQKRYTRYEKIFNVIKFRTMKENVDNYSVTENDDRITKTGKILRKTRLDELPQFFNVLRGEMSVVGPRPEMIENVHKYEKDFPEFRYRLKVKAGLTGIAQIDGKYNTTPKDKLLMDLIYIENYSIWNDMKLMLRTLIVLFKSDSTAGFNEKGVDDEEN